MPTLTYFPPKHPYLKQILTHPGFAKWELKPYLFGEEVDKADAFLLISPFEIKEKFIAPDRIWKQFLQRRLPHLAFFSLGAYPANEPNYLHLFNLPDDFSTHVATALPLSDVWEPYIFGAIDARTILLDFLEGHGGMSFFKAFYRFQSFIIDVLQERKENIPYEETFEELIPDLIFWWEALTSRWNRYQDFFQILPFREDIQLIDGKISQISPFFQEGCENEQLLFDLQCMEALNFIDLSIKNLKTYASK